jgi:hypothetical protein
MENKSRRFPFRWVLPIAQLLLCVVVLWPLRVGLVSALRHSLGYRQDEITVRHLDNLPPINLDLNSPQALRRIHDTELRLWTPVAVNLPVMIISAPYAALSPNKEEWTPPGMYFKFWRAITWPIVGMAFWWLAGRGIEGFLDALRKRIRPRISWCEFGMAMLVLACGAVILGGLLFVRDFRVDMPWVMFVASGLWALLGTTTAVARIMQWRIRRVARLCGITG